MAPLQLDSKADEGGDYHYMLSAENAKFCTAAFGSKYETYADTFEVGSGCSWCTTDRHRE
jgi:hypothetical protein